MLGSEVDEGDEPGPEPGLVGVGIVPLPKDEMVRVTVIPGTSVGYRANGYVVPEITVPSAASALRSAALILAATLKGQESTVVVVSLSSPKHAVLVEQEVCHPN